MKCSWWCERPVSILARPRMPGLVSSEPSHLIYAQISHGCKWDVQYLYTFSNLGLNDSPSKTKLMMLKSNMQIFALWQWHLQEAAKAPVSLVRPINLLRVNSLSSASSVSSPLHNYLWITFTFFNCVKYPTFILSQGQIYEGIFVHRSWTHLLLRHFFKTHQVPPKLCVHLTLIFGLSGGQSLLLFVVSALWDTEMTS